MNQTVQEGGADPQATSQLPDAVAEYAPGSGIVDLRFG